MRGDIPLPAFRLLHSLPVRTHLRAEPKPKAQWTAPAPVAQGMANARAIRRKGVTYKSIQEARRRLRVGMRTLEKWVADGSAEWV